MLFNAANTFKAYVSKCSTHPRSEGKLKINIFHTVGVKIHPKNFSNDEVPDLNANTSGSTNWAKKKTTDRRIYTPLFNPLYLHSTGKIEWLHLNLDATRFSGILLFSGFGGKVELIELNLFTCNLKL